MVEELPKEQSLTPSKMREGMTTFLEGYLFDDNKVRIDSHATRVGGSWQGPPRKNCPTAWDMDVIRFFYKKTLEIDNPVMLDIGANTGSFCLLPSVNPDLTGYAFEPTPMIRNILVSNIALNNLQDKMKVIPMAVSEQEGSQKLKYPKSGKDSGFACLGNPLRFKHWDEIDVPVTTLDRFAKQHNVSKLDMIKIDTEGCELKVLKGGEALIREHHPIILTEFFEQNTLQFGYHAEEIKDLLSSWGYKGHSVGSEDMFFYRPASKMFAMPSDKVAAKDIHSQRQFQDWIDKFSSTNNRLYYHDQTSESLNKLYNLAQQYKPTKIVELGTLSGLSLRTWLYADTDAEIVAVDLSFKHLYENQKIVPIDLSCVKLIEKNALETDFAKLWGPEDRVLFYFDAHDMPNVQIMDHFLSSAVASLPAGSIVIVDDLWFNPTTLDQTNAQTWFHSFVLGQIDELQCFEGYYAPYWKGGSFFGFHEVLPLMAYVNSHKIELSFKTDGKAVWFEVPPSGLPEGDVNSTGRIRGPVGKVSYHPLAWITLEKGLNGDDRELYQVCEKAIFRYAEGDMESAFQCFSKAIKIDRTFPAAYYGLAVIMARMGEWGGALNLLQQDATKCCGIAQVDKLRSDIQNRLSSVSLEKTLMPAGPVTDQITIFSVPKPFNGHIGVIQRNAIKSWLKLVPKPKILLLGNEEGTAQTAAELGVDHLPDIACNQYGTPLLNSIFDMAHEQSPHPILAYVNTDIVLLPDFSTAIEQVRTQNWNHWLMVGRRWNLDITSELDFESKDWSAPLFEAIRNKGELHAQTGIDYFVFPKGAMGEILPFALGRTVWDNWLIKHALDLNNTVVDASQWITAIHQNHGYQHLKGGKEEAWKGVEARQNLALAGGYGNLRNISHAQQKLSSEHRRTSPLGGNTSTSQCVPSKPISAKPKFSIVMIVLNGMPFIEYALASVYDAAHEIIIVEGAVEKCMFSANPDGSSTDGTVGFIESFPDPHHKIKLIQGRWPEKCEMQNKALDFVTGDYVWLVDSDEVYRQEDVVKITEMVTKDPAITQINFICHNFWKGFEHIIYSNKLFVPAFHFRRIFKFKHGARFVSHRPPTMVLPGTEKTTEQMHCLDGMTTWEQGVAIYHYSYVLDAQVQQKMELYRRYGWDKAWEIDMHRWCNEFYSQWTPDRRLELESRFPVWTGDKASYSVPFRGKHPEVITQLMARNPAMQKRSARPFAMRHVVDAIEELFSRNLPGPRIVALETGTIRSYDEKHESTRHISQILGKGGDLISIDISPESIRISRDICKNAENVEWVLSDSLSYLQKHCPDPLHFVLLDSVNDPETIFSEFALIAPNMALNGIVMVDDAGIRSDGGEVDNTPARKGHLVWRFLKECGAGFDVLETVPGHSTQIKVIFTPDNRRRILDRLIEFEKTIFDKSAFVATTADYDTGEIGSNRSEGSKKRVVQTVSSSKKEGVGPHIVIDGVIFQLQAGRPQGISRVWSNIISGMKQQMPGTKMTVLERKGFKVPVKGIVRHEIGLYQLGGDEQLDQDDEMLHDTCQKLNADFFLSTYYTRAPGINNVLMIHDLIPEKLGHDLSCPEWISKQRAIETADAFICVSQITRNDFVSFYPQVAKRPVIVSYNGLDAGFTRPSRNEIEQFRREMHLTGPYVVLVGNRHGYKNGSIALNALAEMNGSEKPTVLCIGGERKPSAAERQLKKRLDIRYAGQLNDKALAAAYGGATALLVPSRQEGFGLPVIEAMACGCPVVANASPAVSEVGGDAVCYADPSSSVDMARAMKVVSRGPHREGLIEKGLRRSERFQWNKAIQRLKGFIERLSDKPSILLTVVVSTYNDEAFIKGCVEDLLGQTIIDRMEIVIVDSASKQGEGAVVKAFQCRHPNIKYIRTPERENVYAAWNRGIKFAAGKYITNANTDDRHRRDAFEIMTRELEGNPEVTLAYADVIKTETPNETFEKCTPTGMLRWHDWNRETLIEKGCFIGPQPMWRREIHEVYGFFDPQYTVAGDYEFWLRISQTSSFLHIPTPLGLYLERPDSIEHTNLGIKSKENRQIVEMYRRASKEGYVVGLNANQGTLSFKRNSEEKQSEKAPCLNADRKKASHETRQGGETMSLPNAILDAVDILIENDQSNAASWIIDKFLSEFSDSAAGHHLKATIAFGQNDLATALNHYENAADLEKDNPAYLKSLGDIYFVGKKDTQMALVQYQKALSIRPDEIGTLIMAGHLHVATRQFDQARRYYQRVLELSPGHREIESFMAQLPEGLEKANQKEVSVAELCASAKKEIESGNSDAAIGMLVRAVAADDNNAIAHNDLGVLFYEQGDKEKAVHHYKKACDHAPENAVFQKNLADFYWAEKSDSQAAMEKYVQVLKLEPQDIEALLGCAQICMTIGKHEDARDFLDCALEIEPWNSDVRQMIGQLDNNVFEEVTPFDSDATYLKAQTKAANGDLQGAIDDLNGLLHHTPDNALAYNDLGVLHYETGDKEKAMACYEKAYELAPEQPNIIKNLADFYLIEQSMVEESMKLYVKVLEKTPEDIDSLMAIATVCTLMGKPEEAIVFYQRVIRLEPWNQEAVQALGKLKGDADSSTKTDKKHAIG